MEYPLIIDGEAAGVLTAEEEGLYIAFTARIRARGELTRLWLHGAGGEKYLGVMMREGEELRLERRISKRELGALWRKTEYASNRSGEEERESSEGESAVDEPTPDKEEADESGGTERERPETKQEPDETGRESDETRSGENEEDGLIWYRTESGTLTAFDGKRRLTALPVRLRHGNKQVELRTIEGREYMIF